MCGWSQHSHDTRVASGDDLGAAKKSRPQARVASRPGAPIETATSSWVTWLVAVALTHGQHPLAVAGHRQVAVAPLLALGRLAPERPAPPGGRVDQVDALVVEVDLDQAYRTVAADQRVGAPPYSWTRERTLAPVADTWEGCSPRRVRTTTSAPSPGRFSTQ